jgi:hypothetical protein
VVENVKELAVRKRNTENMVRGINALDNTIDDIMVRIKKWSNLETAVSRATPFTSYVKKILEGYNDNKPVDTASHQREIFDKMNYSIYKHRSNNIVLFVNECFIVHRFDINQIDEGLKLFRETHPNDADDLPKRFLSAQDFYGPPTRYRNCQSIQNYYAPTQGGGITINAGPSNPSNRVNTTQAGPIKLKFTAQVPVSSTTKSPSQFRSTGTSRISSSLSSSKKPVISTTTGSRKASTLSSKSKTKSSSSSKAPRSLVNNNNESKPRSRVANVPPQKGSRPAPSSSSKSVKK